MCLSSHSHNYIFLTFIKLRILNPFSMWVNNELHSYILGSFWAMFECFGLILLQTRNCQDSVKMFVFPGAVEVGKAAMYRLFFTSPVSSRFWHVLCTCLSIPCPSICNLNWSGLNEIIVNHFALSCPTTRHFKMQENQQLFHILRTYVTMF